MFVLHVLTLGFVIKLGTVFLCFAETFISSVNNKLSSRRVSSSKTISHSYHMCTRYLLMSFYLDFNPICLHRFQTSHPIQQPRQPSTSIPNLDAPWLSRSSMGDYLEMSLNSPTKRKPNFSTMRKSNFSTMANGSPSSKFTHPISYHVANVHWIYRPIYII